VNALKLLRTTLPLAAALSVGASTMLAPAYAQKPAPPKQAEAQTLLDLRMARLQERLALTKAQQAKVRNIQSTHMQRAMTLFEALRSQTTRRERLAVLRQMQALRKDTNARMAGVLSPQQMASYGAFVAEREKELREQLKQRRAANSR